MSQTIHANSLVTLHYRIALENGQTLISTFESNPATLQLGSGELLPSLEQILLGLTAGPCYSFTLAPQEAFGEHQPELIEKVQRQHLPDETVKAMSIMEFSTPDGSRYAGVVRSIDDSTALVDFNHPLAGKSIRFDAQIIAIL